MRAATEVSGFGLRGLMERTLRECPGKALMKAVASLVGDRLDSKYPGSMWVNAASLWKQILLSFIGR